MWFFFYKILVFFIWNCRFRISFYGQRLTSHITFFYDNIKKCCQILTDLKTSVSSVRSQVASLVSRPNKLWKAHQPTEKDWALSPRPLSVVPYIRAWLCNMACPHVKVTSASRSTGSSVPERPLRYGHTARRGSNLFKPGNPMPTHTQSRQVVSCSKDGQILNGGRARHNTWPSTFYSQTALLCHQNSAAAHLWRETQHFPLKLKLLL